MTVRVLPYGPDALLLDTEPERVLALADALGQWLAECGDRSAEVVPAASTVLVMSPGLGRSTARRTALQEVAARALPDRCDGDPAVCEVVEIPVRYVGDDLVEVASHLGCDIAEVIAWHQQSPFVVAFCGFVPGFAYLTGLDPRLHIERRATPRTRVPAGSVAIAAGWAGVYPRAVPGGWHLLGHTDLRIWDPSRLPPTRLQPGVRVRFVSVGA